MANKLTGYCVLTLVVLGCFIGCFSPISAKYTPDWNSLDSRPLPSWYDEAKIGIFLHWGVFSVPSFGNEIFWRLWKTKKRRDVVEFMEKNYPPNWTYADFAQEFTVQEGIFNPDRWANMFNASGARYVVQVTKHNEGFTSWPSNHSFSWNSMDVGPHRDLVGEVSTAVRKYPNLRYGVYYSLSESFNPIYRNDQRSGYKTKIFPQTKSIPELHELVNTYKPDVIWSDGGLTSSDYWGAKEFMAWLYNSSPVRDSVVVNDRWGKDVVCKHGDFFTCHDRYNPGKHVTHKFENAMTLDRHSWGYRRNTQLSDIISIKGLIQTIVTTVSCNGNVLINIGPTKDGMIEPIYEERLRQMGSWLKVNGEGIYKSRPWTYQNDTVNKQVWYTKRDSVVYAFLLQWPTSTQVVLGAPMMTTNTTVSLLGYKGSSLKVTGTPGKQGLTVEFPSIPYNQMPCFWAWTLKITGLKN